MNSLCLLEKLYVMILPFIWYMTMRIREEWEKIIISSFNITLMLANGNNKNIMHKYERKSLFFHVVPSSCLFYSSSTHSTFVSYYHHHYRRKIQHIPFAFSWTIRILQTIHPRAPRMILGTVLLALLVIMAVIFECTHDDEEENLISIPIQRFPLPEPASDYTLKRKLHGTC